MKDARSIRRALLIALLLTLFIVGVVSAVEPVLDSNIFLPLIEKGGGAGSIPTWQ